MRHLTARMERFWGREVKSGHWLYRVSQALDEVVDGLEVVVLQGFFFFLGVGGEILGDEALGFVKIAAKAFVAGKIIADAF